MSDSTTIIIIFTRLPWVFMYYNCLYGMWLHRFGAKERQGKARRGKAFTDRKIEKHTARRGSHSML